MLDLLTIRELPECVEHTEVVPISDPVSGLEAYVAIFNQRGTYPSLGATRLWHYPDSESAARDALRLAKTMAYKAVMADTPYGGAKGVIMATTNDPQVRAQQLKAYARALRQLEGRFITGTDVGISNDDMDIFLSEAPYFIGKDVPSALYTAIGVFLTIQALMLQRTPPISAPQAAIQGLGKTGEELARLLLGAGYIVYGADIEATRAARVGELLPGLQVVTPDELVSLSVDVFSPCGVGGSVTETLAEHLLARAVVGAANNQLQTALAGEILFKRGIEYAPDFVVNAGGLLSVVDQYEHGSMSDERIREAVKKIPGRVLKILDQSHNENRPPEQVAEAQVHERLEQTVV